MTNDSDVAAGNADASGADGEKTVMSSHMAWHRQTHISKSARDTDLGFNDAIY